jgi:hypothetical protein
MLLPLAWGCAESSLLSGDEENDVADAQLGELQIVTTTLQTPGQLPHCYDAARTGMVSLPKGCKLGLARILAVLKAYDPSTLHQTIMLEPVPGIDKGVIAMAFASYLVEGAVMEVDVTEHSHGAIKVSISTTNEGVCDEVDSIQVARRAWLHAAARRLRGQLYSLCIECLN